MATHLTDAILDQFTEANIDPEDFISKFDAWKAGDEYESYTFGKDGAYVAPKVNNKAYQLRHVHLAPIKDPEEIADWKKKWKLRSRKTSDRILVYVDGASYGHLLLWIFDEPNGHLPAKMTTGDDKQLMYDLAMTAAEFLYDGSILA